MPLSNGTVKNQNSILAGIVFQHPGIESITGELRRNGQLCQLCGYDISKGITVIPKSWNFSRFLHKRKLLNIRN